jgi:hypothetical protein
MTRVVMVRCTDERTSGFTLASEMERVADAYQECTSPLL